MLYAKVDTCFQSSKWRLVILAGEVKRITGGAINILFNRFEEGFPGAFPYF